MSSRRGSADWVLKFADNRSKKGWQELQRQFPGPLTKAYDAILADPRCRTRPKRQWPLKATLSTRKLGSRSLEQWQYDVTGSARVWYCIDDEPRVLWVTHAAVGHPKKTD